MNRLLPFLQKHFLIILLLSVIVVLLTQRTGYVSRNSVSMYQENGMSDGVLSAPSSLRTKSIMPGMPAPMPYSPIAPTDQQDRLVITDTSLSLVVKNVKDVLGKIQELAKQQSGFLIDSNLSKPEEGGTGTISIRVPTEKINETLEALRGLSVKVVSEHVSGSDVTDQYVDLDARLAVLQQTKTKFEEILTKATEVEEMLQVQQQLISLQDQIDAIKGQQQYLEKSAALSRITIYLSTDELALPYSPDNAWRPGVVFKQAVRSLAGFLRDLGSLLIWVGVFAVIWVPVLVAILLGKRLRRRVTG